MRDYLGSDDMLPATDRSYLLRLKNSRSASRLSLCSLQRKYAADDASFSSGQLCLLGLQALLDPCSFLGALSAHLFHSSYSSIYSARSSSPPIAAKDSPRFEAQQISELPANKRYAFFC